MNPEQKKRIQSVWLKLIDSISDVDRVVDGLVQESVLTRSLREKIDSEKGDTKKIRAMLDILLRRGPDAFDKFYNVLVAVDEDAAADFLCPELAEQRKANKQSGVVTHYEISRQGVFVPTEDDDTDELPKRWPDPNKEVHDPMRLKVEYVPEDGIGREMRNKFDKALKSGTDSTIYPMHRPIRGNFLLINNKLFKEARANGVKLDDREGTDLDVMALDHLFSQLGFQVFVKSNLNAREMMEAIEEQAMTNHIAYDCFACAVLTHGEKGSIYGVDGELVGLDKFKDAVDGTNCLTLIGKPKLFFIQACQGKAFDRGSGIGGGAGAAEPDPKKLDNVQDPEKEAEENIEKMTNLRIRDEKHDASSETTVPSKADIFVAMATVEDFISWRSTNWGTFFVQAIAYVFSRLAYKYELNQLMLRVNRLVGRAETKKKFKQISVFSNQLTSELYFFPGLQSTMSESHSEPDLKANTRADISVQSSTLPGKGSTLVAQASSDEGLSMLAP